MTEYTCPFCGAFDQMGAVCEYCKRRLREEPEKQVRSILYACGKKVAVVYDDNELHWLVE